VVLHRYDAGHAFSNWDAPTFYDEQAASKAWPRTLDFLAEHLNP
jgi:carboxymethylenebutenolidase